MKIAKRRLRPWSSTWRRIAQGLEGLAFVALSALFRLLPVDAASALGGGIARRIGPRLRISDRARDNLLRVLPELDAAARERVILGVWDNLGRVAAELPHLAGIVAAGPQPRVIIAGGEELVALRAAGKPAIFFSAHCGNWELLGPAAARLGIPLTMVYRAANNAWVERLVQGLRERAMGNGSHVPKGAEAAKEMLQALRRRHWIAMLADQKMNDGIPVPFFGEAAMTAPAIARLSIRFGCPLVPAVVERIAGAHFRIRLFPPLSTERSGDIENDVLVLMTRINAMVEGWIRERPAQWLWLHKRWPD